MTVNNISKTPTFMNAKSFLEAQSVEADTISFPFPDPAGSPPIPVQTRKLVLIKGEAKETYDGDCLKDLLTLEYASVVTNGDYEIDLEWTDLSLSDVKMAMEVLKGSKKLASENILSLFKAIDYFNIQTLLTKLKEKPEELLKVLKDVTPNINREDKVKIFELLVENTPELGIEILFKWIDKREELKAFFDLLPKPQGDMQRFFFELYSGKAEGKNLKEIEIYKIFKNLISNSNSKYFLEALDHLPKFESLREPVFKTMINAILNNGKMHEFMAELKIELGGKPSTDSLLDNLIKHLKGFNKLVSDFNSLSYNQIKPAQDSVAGKLNSLSEKIKEAEVIKTDILAGKVKDIDIGKIEKIQKLQLLVKKCLENYQTGLELKKPRQLAREIIIGTAMTLAIVALIGCLALMTVALCTWPTHLVYSSYGEGYFYTVLDSNKFHLISASVAGGAVVILPVYFGVVGALLQGSLNDQFRQKKHLLRGIHRIFEKASNITVMPPAENLVV